MTHEFINNLLEENNESPVLFDYYVLNIRKGRSIIYMLSGDSDYKQLDFEICYADKHHDVIWKGIVESEEQLKEVVLESLK